MDTHSAAVSCIGSGYNLCKEPKLFHEQAPAARQLIQLTQENITSFAITGKDGKSVELEQHDTNGV